MDKKKLDSVDRYRILDSGQDRGFDRLVEMAAKVCDCSHATLSIINKKRFWIKSSYNFDLDDISEEDSMCQITIESPNELQVISDISKLDAKDKKVKYLQTNNINFYAGKSIVDPEGIVIGTLCVLDPEPRKLSQTQKNILKDLSDEAMDKIISHKEKLELEELNKSISDGKGRFQTLLNNTGDLVFLLDSDLNFIEFYGDEENLLVEKEDLIGKHIDEITSINKIASKIKMAVKASTLYNSSIPIEYDLTTDGVQRWFNMNVNVIKRENHNNEILCDVREVSDRKKTEKKLKLINNLFKEAESLARVGGWRYDVKKGELFWTPILKKIAEIDSNIQPSLEEAKVFFKDGKSIELITEKVLESIHFNTSYTGEFEILTAKKRPLWALINIKPEIIDGECVSVYGSFQDITESKKNKEKLKQERERLNNIINATNLGTWEWNVQTGEAKFNNRFVEMLGYSTHDIPLNNSISAWNDRTHPEDLKNSNLALEDHFQGNTDFYKFELRLKHKEGHWVWILDKGKVISWTEDGQPEWMFGTHQDISDKKMLEKDLKQNVLQFKNIFELSPVGIVITEFTSGKFLDINKAMQDMVGYTEDEILGMSIWTITPEKTITSKDSKSIENLKNLNRIGPIEKVLKTKSGDLITVVINGLIHFDKKGNRIVISTLQDVTEQKKIEKRLKNSETEAIKASQAKSEFVANMSHEIRTPLNGVIGFSDLLMKTPLNDVQHQYMKTVFQSANILLDLINDVLDFSKIESGKLQLDTDKTNLLKIAEEVVDLIKYEAHKKGLELILVVDDKVPDYVWVDGVRFKQILINLLNNAIKFTKEGSVKFKISCKNNVDDLANLVFSVEDTGVGIAKENQKKIFNAFIQEDTSITKKYGGTGLGLAISDKILNLMDSKLRLKSEIGQGSNFYFEISLRSEKNPKTQTQTIEDVRDILVVSSFSEHFETIRSHYGGYNLKLHYANDLETASKRLVELSPQVIFVNQEDSLELSCSLTSRLKTNTKSKNVRFILLKKSNANDRAEEIKLKRCFEHLIVKPIKKIDLLRVMTNEDKPQSDLYSDSKKIKTIEETEGLKFLIAEDNLINMELIKSYLTNIYSKVNIYEAEDGLKALKLFKKHTPDIVFSDIQMPNMNGYELAEAIRKEKKGKTTPIIAITAGTVVGTKEKCIEAGMNDYISKPILQESLRNVILKYSPDNNQLVESSDFHDKTSADESKDEIFNRNQVMAMIGHNEKFFDELINLANDSLVEALENLREIENEDQLKKLAHKVKGTALNLGANSLSDSALRIEKSKIKTKKELVTYNKELDLEINKLIEALPELSSK
jgi:PAS domain S-box-containing protein